MVTPLVEVSLVPLHWPEEAEGDPAPQAGQVSLSPHPGHRIPLTSPGTLPPLRSEYQPRKGPRRAGISHLRVRVATQHPTALDTSLGVTLFDKDLVSSGPPPLAKRVTQASRER